MLAADSKSELQALAAERIEMVSSEQLGAKRELGFVDYDIQDSFFEPLPESELEEWE